MLIIKETFIAKPGNAGKLAKLFREAFNETPEKDKVRILTDYIGPFNTIVIETQIESLSEYEKRMEEYSKENSFADKLKGYTEMYKAGKREVYRVI